MQSSHANEEGMSNTDNNAIAGPSTGLQRSGSSPAFHPSTLLGPPTQYYYDPSGFSQGLHTNPPSYGYYTGYPSAGWNNMWPVPGAQPGHSGNEIPSYSVHTYTPVQGRTHVPASDQPSSTPPPFRKHWDEAIKGFLISAGLTQTLRAFEADMLILSPDFERHKIPTALEKLMNDLTTLRQSDTTDTGSESHTEASQGNTSLEDRKLNYVHFADQVTPKSHSSVTKSISRFLAQNRARNDSSNREEFILSLADKRRRADIQGEIDEENATSIPSCARTDAKTQNRDIQMKYDIAKNEDGPLRKTIQDRKEESLKDVANNVTSGEEHNPGLDERLQNIEKHLAVRYVPSVPRTLLDRLRFLEDHIIHLEKEYPPWAALHFNQPLRGWPPPPRPTPIIVPSHLTASSTQDGAVHTKISPVALPSPSVPEAAESASQKGRTKLARNTKSSLHRAVMERLEVQKAMNDLTGTENSSG